jgi:DNA-binding NarL/FixJ family response regulator
MDKSVLVVDDHPLFCKALVNLLREMGCREVIAAGSAEEGLARIRGGEPDLVLLDLGLPGVAGVDAISLFRRSCAATIIVVSASEQRQAVEAALRAGAVAVVSKSVSLDTLQDIVQQVLAGTWAEPKWVRPAGSLSMADDGTHAMTPRQQEIAAMLLDGHSNKEMAARLGLAEITVKMHVSAIFRLLGVVNRTQAAGAIRRLGLDAGAGER